MSHSLIVVLNNSEYDCDQIFEEMESSGNRVDYVIESQSDFKEDFAWCKECVSGIGIVMNESDSTLNLVSPEHFWSSMKSDVISLLDEPNFAYSRYKLTNRVTMKHDLWIYLNGELLTLPYFVELYTNEFTHTFTVTKLLDYHF